MYHCGVLSASCGVKSRPAALRFGAPESAAALGLATAYPCDGLRKTEAPMSPATR